MAMFGAPLLHDDDPERAVRAALSMVDRAPLMNRGACAPIVLPPLSVGVGIHTGDVVAEGWDPTSEASTASSATP
jgi:class 3 adenylate cyclase